MKKIYLSLLNTALLILLLVFTSSAQFYPVTHLSGTLMIGGINVTVDGAGPTPYSSTGNAICNASNLYGIGAGGASLNGYKFSFSKPVTRVRFRAFGIQYSDAGRFYINGNQYILTSANISYPSGVCSTLTPAIAFNGDIVSPLASGPCVTSGFNGQVDFFPSTPIDSITHIAIANACQGYGVYFYFASDTLAYIKQPYTDTVLCAGDTFKLRYTVSNTFNSGNVFTAQLSNSSGSFASPTTIGSKTATGNDSIVCVLPKTLAGGTGYRVRIVSSNPVMTSFDNSVNIRIKPLPANYNATSNSPLCEPDTVRLFGTTTSTGVGFSWQGPNSFSSTAQNPKAGNSASSTHSGNYIVTMTLNGCSIKDTAAVTVNALPAKPTAGSNTPLCLGATLNLTGTTTTGGVIYNWTGPNGFSSSLQNPSKTGAVLADNGNYIVTVSLNGCTARDTETVVIYPATATPTAGNTGPYCTGSNIQLTASSISGASYTWAGPNSFTAITQNPVVPVAGMTAAGTYTVYATVNGCNSNTASTTVSIVNGPSVLMYPSPNDSICVGTTATFTASVTNGGTAPQYQWLKNGTAIPGATALTHSATGLIDGDKITFLLTPGSGAACSTPVNSNSITMTVLQYTQPIVEIAGDTNAWPGLLVTFNVSNVSGGANPQYQWKVNNQNIVGATGSTWGTTTLSHNDQVCVVMTPSFLCPSPATAIACKKMKVATGIAQFSNGKLKVYPNPTNEVLHIEGIDKGTRITLTDMLGRKVYNTTATISGTTVITTKQLPAGNYILQLNYTDGTRDNVKLVKE